MNTAHTTSWEHKEQEKLNPEEVGEVYIEEIDSMIKGCFKLYNTATIELRDEVLGSEILSCRVKLRELKEEGSLSDTYIFNLSGLIQLREIYDNLVYRVQNYDLTIDDPALTRLNPIPALSHAELRKKLADRTFASVQLKVEQMCAAANDPFYDIMRSTRERLLDEIPEAKRKGFSRAHKNILDQLLRESESKEQEYPMAKEFMADSNIIAMNEMFRQAQPKKDGDTTGNISISSTKPTIRTMISTALRKINSLFGVKRR